MDGQITFSCFERSESLKQQVNSAAIYCRLSRDDGGDAESNSIATQRSMLQRYAREQAFIVREEHIYIEPYQF